MGKGAEGNARHLRGLQEAVQALGRKGRASEILPKVSLVERTISERFAALGIDNGPNGVDESVMILLTLYEESQISFKCADCGKASDGGLIGAALTALMDAGEINPDPKTVTECGAIVLTKLLDAFMAGNQDVAKLIDAFSNADDDVVKGLGILNRQAVWTVLNMLKKEKVRRDKAKPKAASPDPSPVK